MKNLTDLYPADTYGEPAYHVYLEYMGDNEKNLSGKSNKFWECIVVQSQGGGYITVRRWGRYGSKGQSTFRRFFRLGAARDFAREHAAKKRAKGYTREIDVVTRMGAVLEDR